MTKSDLVELAKFLKDTRIIAGLSQKEIAEQLGYSIIFKKINDFI